MSEVMRQIPFDQLIEWSLDEYNNTDTIFGIHKHKFYKNETGKTIKTVFGDEISSAVGPAAGPHGQIAQNLIVSYLTGARFIEVKTVQIMDGEEIANAINRPCILSTDEVYNCEWSTELTVQQAFEEYVKGYIAIRVLAKELGISDIKDFAYNMSVGYDLKGIQSEKVDTYIEGMKDASETEVFQKCIGWLKDNVDMFENVTLEDIEDIDPNICDDITLSTLHGCPADEIESIANYLLTEKDINTFVKCNPTMLGYDYVRETLDSMGFDYISFTDHHFKNDLQFEDAIGMFERLRATAKEHDRAFGLKITNTCPVDVERNELPSDEMYMSGRSLLPLSLSMAAMLSEQFNGEIPISYSGGAEGLNIKKIFEALNQPITVASTLLKPGGYERFNQLAEECEELLGREYTGVDVDKIIEVRDEVVAGWEHNKLYREKVESRKTASELPFVDCFKAPCKDGGCPIEQQIPEYLKLVSEEKYDEAIEVIANDNTAPTILGILCAHHCQEHCTRIDYEKTLQIRDMKLIAAEEAQEEYINNIKPVDLKSDKKVLVIGAGPGGIAAASYLRRNGVDVTVREKLEKPYGIVSHVIPEFRIPDAEIEKDYKIAVNQGVNFEFNTEVTESYQELKENFDYVVVATGAWDKGYSPVEEGQENITDAIDFLWNVRMEGGHEDLGKSVAVIGAGDVAMDCVRTALRQDGVEDVKLIYRRTEAYMPATQEEVNDVKDIDGIEILELVGTNSYDGKTLVCEKMDLGDFDESGRRAVTATGETFELEFDTVIGATGAQVDKTAFVNNKLNCDDSGYAKLLPSLETSEENVYVIGDCRRGASTIVKAMGDAKVVALDILEKENLDNDFRHFDVKEDIDTIIKKRGVQVPVIEGHKEGSRCLTCDQVCEICTEVCPNRANVAIKVAGYEDYEQIIHIDGMCNECGNCGVHCPHTGNPYLDKYTIFWTEEDFDVSDRNTGFYKKDDENYKVRLENGNVIEARLDDDKISKDLKAFIEAVEENYSYYIKPTNEVI